MVEVVPLCLKSSYKSLSSTSRCSWDLQQWAGWQPAWSAGRGQWRWQQWPRSASSWTCRSGMIWGPSGPCEPAGGPEEGSEPDWRSPCSVTGPDRLCCGSAGQRCVYHGSTPSHSDLQGSHMRAWSFVKREHQSRLNICFQQDPHVDIVYKAEYSDVSFIKQSWPSSFTEMWRWWWDSYCTVVRILLT